MSRGDLLPDAHGLCPQVRDVVETRTNAQSDPQMDGNGARPEINAPVLIPRPDDTWWVPRRRKATLRS